MDGPPVQRHWLTRRAAAPSTAITSPGRNCRPLRYSTSPLTPGNCEGLDVGLGELCRVTSLTDERSILAEVVGFHEQGRVLGMIG